MAMSFSHPDPSSPAAVADATFSTGRRGFDQAEVRDFLRMVAAELGRLQERERFLERELRSAQSSPDLASAALSDDDLTRLLGEETARVIATARESASEIRSKAEQAAARMVSEASDEAKRIREEADLEASRRRADANSDAEAEISMAKQQGRDMVNEARAYRERVLSELARRRELAREQIEQLIHGRDRLMQSFERARLVAVEIVGELQPLGEPNEYVNLAPTTGPVPVMVPRAVPAAAPAEGEHGGGGSSDFADFDRAAEADELPEADEVEVQASAESDAIDDTAHSADSAGETDEVESADTATDEVDDAAAVDDADDAAAADDADEAEADEAEAADSATDEAGAADDAAEEPRETMTTEVDDAATLDDPPEEPSETVTDDVVIDLFARIRAGAETPHLADASASDSEEPDTATSDTTTEAVAIGESSGVEQSLAGHADVESTPFERRDEDLTPLIVASAKKLKRVLADEQNDLLDVLRRDASVTELESLLPSGPEHIARYADAIATELAAAAQAGADSAGTTRALRPATSTLACNQARAVLEEYLVHPLRDRVARAVSESAGDNEEITRTSRAIYREWKTQHIAEQLDDVLRAAYGRGRLAGFPARTPLRWTPDPARPPCPDCEDNALAGPVEAGTGFPTGDIFAPAHPGCRCLLTAADR